MARDGSRGQRIQGGAVGAFQGGVEPDQQTASGALRGAEGRAGPQPRTEDGALRRHQELAAQPLTTRKEWNRASDRLLEIQKTWKTIGFAPKRTTTAYMNVSARRATGSSRPSGSSMPG
ncbi:MAG: DUF349 domain-containing protein [Alistipes finegoldii]